MKQPLKYTFTFQYGYKNITCNFWLTQKGGSPPDVVIFLGAGQVGSIPRWVAQAADAGMVVVDGLPHWEAHSSGEDMAQFAAAYVQAAFEKVLKTFGVAELNVIAESQAVPASVIMVRNIPDRVRNMVLIRPLGFTVRSFGSSEQARLKIFRRRILQTVLQLIRHPRNIAIGMIMLRAMFREPSLAVLNKKYAIGISYDLIEDCRQAAKTRQNRGYSLTLLLGEKDRLFPPKEVLAALVTSKINGVDVRIIPKAGHASLATPSSKAILKQAIDIVRFHQRVHK